MIAEVQIKGLPCNDSGLGSRVEEEGDFYSINVKGIDLAC